MHRATPWQSAGRRGFAKDKPPPPILAGSRVQMVHNHPTGPEVCREQQ